MNIDLRRHPPTSLRHKAVRVIISPLKTLSVFEGGEAKCGGDLKRQWGKLRVGEVVVTYRLLSESGLQTHQAMKRRKTTFAVDMGV